MNRSLLIKISFPKLYRALSQFPKAQSYVWFPCMVLKTHVIPLFSASLSVCVCVRQRESISNDVFV